MTIDQFYDQLYNSNFKVIVKDFKHNPLLYLVTGRRYVIAVIRVKVIQLLPTLLVTAIPSGEEEVYGMLQSGTNNLFSISMETQYR